MSTSTPSEFTLRHPHLDALHRLWREHCRGGKLPAAADLDPVALRPWLGNLLVVDSAPGGGFVYRYYGAVFASRFGGDRVGQSIDSLPPPQRDILRAEYQRVCAAGAPVARVYAAEFDGVPATWERLALPLASDGRIVDKIMVAAYEMDRRQGADA